MSEAGEARARSVLRTLFDTAVESALPRHVLEGHLPSKPRGRCVVIGAGKASAAMAAELERLWPDVEMTGVVATRYDHAVPTRRIKIIESAHPVADENSLLAASEMLDAVAGLGENDLVLSLMSGGGSAIACLPAGDITLEEKQALNRQLLMSGATIGEMNVVRQSVSAIKGGRLAAAAGPASVVTLVISDIPGDDPALVGSGPTVISSTPPGRAREIVERLGLDLPPRLAERLARPDPLPSARPQDRVATIASPHLMLEAAARKADSLGYRPIILGDAIEGESRELGIAMAGIARSVGEYAHPIPSPAVLLSGGETTVTVRDGRAGQGGRNTEFLLSLACKLNGRARIAAIAGDTDGIDGSSDAAGAIIDPTTLARARAMGLDANRYLDGHDSYSLFSALGDLVTTGPTLTNVNDFRAVLVW